MFECERMQGTDNKALSLEIVADLVLSTKPTTIRDHLKMMYQSFNAQSAEQQDEIYATYLNLDNALEAMERFNTKAYLKDLFQ